MFKNKNKFVTSLQSVLKTPVKPMKRPFITKKNFQKMLMVHPYGVKNNHLPSIFIDK